MSTEPYISKTVRKTWPKSERYRLWVERLRSFAMSEAEMTCDLTADYWRSCFDSGMSPEQAFRESFTE